MTLHAGPADVVIAGAGIAGIATAYHLAVGHGLTRVVISDPRPPLSLTSDKSTECYRNWWPGPDDTMVAFMNRSIDLLEQWSNDSHDAFNLSRRGYLYVTAAPGELERMTREAQEIARLGAGDLRIHDHDLNGYQAVTKGWMASPDGADLFTSGGGLRTQFPALTERVIGGLHVRRAGWLSGQQLGMWLLDRARDHGVYLARESIVDVEVEDDAVKAVQLSSGDRVATSCFVNAAGPMVSDVGRLVGTDLPVHSEVHRKVSFSDRLSAVPRNVPLLIWNDPQQLEWTADEQDALGSDPETAALTGHLPPGVHCRPDGPDDATTVFGLWEYRKDVRAPHFPIPIDDMCPETVLRGLSTMIPGMSEYVERMPQPYVDGGYYTKTHENRPLIGPVGPRGSYVVGALSGFGVMAAPAAGELIARHITGTDLPGYADFLAPARYRDPEYGAVLAGMTGEGQL